MEDEKKKAFDMYFAAAVQGLLSNEQCKPFSFAFDYEEVVSKASRIAAKMLRARERVYEETI